jgi:hypothetical protein
LYFLHPFGTGRRWLVTTTVGNLVKS